MIEIDGKIYRNLEEQVRKNKDDIEELQGQSPDTSIIEQRLEVVESQINNLTPQVDASLKKLSQAPIETELVAINSSNNQTMITIGDGLILENNTLKSTGGQQQDISIDNETITKNTNNEIQAVALKNRIVDIKNNTINKNNFSGIYEVTKEQYLDLLDGQTIIINGENITYDENVLYVTPDLSEDYDDRISELENTVTELTPDVMRALKTPMARPTTTEIVAVDNTNSQAMLSIGDGLTIENDTLKVTGGSGGGVQVIDNLSSTSTTSALSANQGRLLDMQLSGVSAVADGNTEQIEFLQSDVAGKTNVTINNVHQDYINFSSDPQTQLNNSVKSNEFSKNTKTTFGSWDIFKRKKISSSSLLVSTVNSGTITPTSMQLTETLSYGDMFEIEYGVGADFAVTKIARFTYKGGTSTVHSFEVEVVTSSDNTIYTGSCYGYIDSTGLLTIQNWVLYQITPNQGQTSGSQFEIYNVYKVI